MRVINVVVVMGEIGGVQGEMEEASFAPLLLRWQRKDRKADRTKSTKKGIYSTCCMVDKETRLQKASGCPASSLLVGQ